MDNIKIGTCIINNTENFIEEGIVFDVYLDYSLKTEQVCDILWFKSFKREKKCSFKIVKNMYVKDMDYEIAINPHFCSIEKLFENFNKYKNINENLEINNYMLLGCNMIRTSALISYFKTGNCFCEIAGLFSNAFQKNNYVYINEANSLEDLHFNNIVYDSDSIEGFYTSIEGNTFVHAYEFNKKNLKKCNINDFCNINLNDYKQATDDKCFGIVFKDLADDYPLSFVEFIDKSLKQKYKMGVQVDLDFSFMKKHNFKDFLYEMLYLTTTG